MKNALLWLVQHFFYVVARKIDAGKENGSYLVIAPHPDDETLGCGGTIALACKKKQKIRVVIVTDGSAACHSSKISQQELAQMRYAEATKAVETLGAKSADIIFLNFPDKKAAENILALQEAFLTQITSFKPTQIYSPYKIDMNPDHVAIAEAIDRLHKANLITCPVYEYPVWFTPRAMLMHAINPLFWLRLRYQDVRACLTEKRKALEAHHTQLENITGEPDWFTLTPRFIARFFYGFELFFEKSR